jgi:hypothetical protein
MSPCANRTNHTSRYLLVKNKKGEVMTSFEVKNKNTIFKVAKMFVNKNGEKYSISAEKDENNNYITPFSYFLLDNMPASAVYVDEEIHSSLIFKTKKKVSWNL